jgi:hypothetical protein
MPTSTWGKRHDLPGYDKFRSGLTYVDVYAMLRTSKKHSQKRRGSVLGFWHELKLQLYEQAVDRGYLEQLEMEEALRKSERAARRRSRSPKVRQRRAA